MNSKYFTTSDGQEFYTENNAQAHARTLADKKVSPPSVEEFEVVDEEVLSTNEDASNEDASNEDAPTEDAPTEAAPIEAAPTEDAPTEAAPKDEAKAVEVNLSKMTKPQLIAFAFDNELTVDGTATNALIIAAIEAQLTEKNQA